VVVLLSLLAATAYGLGTVLQQRGTLECDDGDDGGDDGVRFLAGLLRRPVWLLGGVVTALGGVCQTLALRTGPLAAVQAMTTLSLVIALPFGVWLTDQLVTPLVWAGACATTAGVVLFVAVGSPQNDTSEPGAAAWWAAGLSTAALAGVLVRAGSSRSGGPRALLFGTAAGLGFGMASALVKALTGRFAQGLGAVLTSWELYALAAAALLGLATGQAALRTGALAPAMASTNSVALLASVALGLTVFGERFERGQGHLVAVGVGLAVALLGIVLLSRAPTPAGRSAAPAAEV
jgi:drug/metabolite transporter (DMT)-like permease